VSERFDLDVSQRSIFVDVPVDDVERAVLEVGAASRDVAEHIIDRALKDSEADISDDLREKLTRIFRETVEFEEKVVGASSTAWDVSALTRLEDRVTVFQAVPNHRISIYRTTTAFHDISALDNPPGLVSVVPDKGDMGPNPGLLAQVGKVIEIGMSDDRLRRLAA